MRHSTVFPRVVFVFILLGVFSGSAWAQSGKLAGQVTDAETGDPLPGVNVTLEGTQIGTATDVNGHYDLIGVTPGEYTVQFSMVGYEERRVLGVRIQSNSTRTLNIELGEGVIEGEGVTVVAEQPIVQRDQTTSRTVFSSEDIEQLPATNLQDVVSNTAKSYEGFVRGSREFGTKTVIEGIDVSDDFARASSINQNTRRGYGSTIRVDQRGGLFNLSAGGVEEVSVNTGATSASAPSGSGGVIDVTLAEGRGPIGGSFSMRITPKINQPGPDSLAFYPDEDVEAYFEEKQLVADNGEEVRSDLYTWDRDKYNLQEAPEMNVDFSVGGAVTEDFRFSAAGQLFQTEGFRPNEFRRHVNGQLKASYDLSGSTEITAIGLVEDRGLWGGWNNRNYAELWRFYLEGTGQDDGGNYVGSLRLRQVLSDNSFINFQVYRKFARTRYGYADDNGNGWVEPGEDGDFINFLKTENIEKYIFTGEGDEADKMFFYNPFPLGRSEGVITTADGEPIRVSGPMPHYENSERVTNAFKVDYNNQITSHHLIQAGVELQLKSIDHQEAMAEYHPYYTLNGELDVNGDGVNDIEPFRPETWKRSPTELSVYLSDRIEYGDLIVNLGLRTDIVDRDMEKITDHFFPLRRDTVTVDGRTVARNFLRRGDDVPLDVFWNPRIGVSHPISDRAAVYFSYARSEQLAPYSTLYDFYDGNHTSTHFTPTYQDPEQDPIVSNDYELGAQWEFIPDWGLDVNAYARSIDNYGRQNLRANNRTPEGEQDLSGINWYTFQTSAGYADVRGLEVQVQRRPLEIFRDVALGMTASYTYSTVETDHNASNQTQFNADSPDIEDNQLPFDNVNNFNHFPEEVGGGSSIISAGYNRRHRALLRGIGVLPYGFSLGLDARYESGFLYEKVVDADPRDRELLEAPYNFRIDLRLEKQFSFSDRFGIDLFLDVRNLTNRDNMIAYNAHVNNGTARLQTESNPGDRLILIDGSPIYGPARNVYFGTQVRF